MPKHKRARPLAILPPVQEQAEHDTPVSPRPVSTYHSEPHPSHSSTMEDNNELTYTEPPRPRMIPRPAADRTNRHSLIPLVKELDASLPPSTDQPEVARSQSAFDWSDDEIDPRTKAARTRKHSKAKDAATRSDKGLQHIPDELSLTISESKSTQSPALRTQTPKQSHEDKHDSFDSQLSTHSSQAGQKLSEDHSPGTGATPSVKGSIVRAVKSLKNLHATASRSASSLISATPSLTSLVTEPPHTQDTPPVPTLPVSFKPFKDVAPESRPTSAEDLSPGSLYHGTTTPRSQKPSPISTVVAPQMRPIMGSFLGSPTLFLASPTPSPLPSSPTTPKFSGSRTPASLPRSASSPSTGFASLNIAKKIRRQFSSQPAAASSSTGQLFDETRAVGTPGVPRHQDVASKNDNHEGAQPGQQAMCNRLFDAPLAFDNARELATTLIARGSLAGLVPVRSATQLTDNEVEYIAQSYKELCYTRIQNYLFECEVHDEQHQHEAHQSVMQGLGIAMPERSDSIANAQTSDTASVFSNLSVSKIDKALGPDYDPHLSTFGLDASQYLEGLDKQKKMDVEQAPRPGGSMLGPDRQTLKARRSSVDPTKIKMTPELRQDIADASIVRAKQIETMQHPLFRGEGSGNSTNTTASGAGSGRTDTTRYATHQTDLIPPGQLEAAIDELLEKLTLDAQAACPPEPEPDESGRLSETQQLRQDFGLQLLRAPEPGTQKHPKHIFQWSAAKLMCRSIHNPMEILSPFPTLQPGTVTSLSSFGDNYFRNVNTAEYQAPRKCANPACDQYCCHYGKLMVDSAIKDNDVVFRSKAMRCSEEAARIKARRPNGVEEWENFLKCTFCLKLYCPACIKLCGQWFCQQPFCVYCSKGNVDCEDHDE